MEAICLPCNPSSQHRQRFGMCAKADCVGEMGLPRASDMENAHRQPSSESAQSGLIIEQQPVPSGLLQGHHRSANGQMYPQPAAFAAEDPGGSQPHTEGSQQASSPSSAAAPLKEASAVIHGSAEPVAHRDTTQGPNSMKLQPLTGRLVLTGTDGAKRSTLAAAECNQRATQAAAVASPADKQPHTGHVMSTIPSGSPIRSPEAAASEQQPFIAAAERRPLVGNVVFAGARAKAPQIAAMQDTQQADEAPPPAPAGQSTAAQTQLADHISQGASEGASEILLLSDATPPAEAASASGKMQPLTGHLILPAAARPPVGALRQPQQAASVAVATPELRTTTDVPPAAAKSPIAAAAEEEEEQPEDVSPAANLLENDVAAALGLVLLHAQPADSAAAAPSDEENHSIIIRPRHLGSDQDPLLLPRCQISGHQAGFRASATSASGFRGPPGQQGFARHQGLAGFGSPNKHRAASARVKAAKKQSHRFVDHNAHNAVAAADRHQHRQPVGALGAAAVAPACGRKPNAAAKSTVAVVKTAAAEPSAAAVLLQKVQLAMQQQTQQRADDPVLMLAAAAAPWYPPAHGRGSFLVQKQGKLVPRKMYALPAGTASAAADRPVLGNNSSSRSNILLHVLQQQMQQDQVAGYNTGQDDSLACAISARRTAPVATAAGITHRTDAEMEQKLKLLHQAHSAGHRSPTNSPVKGSYSQQQDPDGGLHDLQEAATALVQAAAAAVAASAQDDAAEAERRHNPRRKRKMPSKLEDTLNTDCALQIVYGRGPKSSQAASAAPSSPHSAAATRLKRLLLLEQQQQQPTTDPVQHLKDQLGNAASVIKMAAATAGGGGHGAGGSSLQNPKQQQQQQLTWQQHGWWVGKGMCQRDMHRQWWDWAEQEQQQIEQQEMEELLNRYVSRSTPAEPNPEQQLKQQQQESSSDCAEDHQHGEQQQRSRLTLDEVGLAVWSCLARQPSTAAAAADAAAHQGAATAYKQLSAMATAVHRAATAQVVGTTGRNPALAAFMLPCKTLGDLQQQHVSRIDDSAATRPLTRHAAAAAATRAGCSQVHSSKATTVSEIADETAMMAAAAVAAAADAAASRAARHAQRAEAAAAAASGVCKKRPAADCWEPSEAPAAEQPAVDVDVTASQRSSITDDTDLLFESIVMKKRCLKDQLGAKAGSHKQIPAVAPKAAVVDLTDSPPAVEAFKLPASVLAAAAAAATAVPAPWKSSTSKPPTQGASNAAYKQQRRRKKPRAPPPMLKNQQQIEQLLLCQQDLRSGSVPADVRRQQQQQLQELMQRVTQQRQQEQQQARVQALMLRIQAQQQQLHVRAESPESESPRVSKEQDEQPQPQPGLFRVVLGQGSGQQQKEQQQQQQVRQQRDQQVEAAAADHLTANGHFLGPAGPVMNTNTYGSMALMPDQQHSQLQQQQLPVQPIQPMQMKPATFSCPRQPQQQLSAAPQPVFKQLEFLNFAAKQQLSSVYPAGRARAGLQSQHLQKAQLYQVPESAGASASLPLRNVQHQLLPQQPFCPQQPFYRQQHTPFQRVPHSMMDLQLTAAPVPAAVPSAAAAASSGSASAAVAASRARLLAALGAENDAQPRPAAVAGGPASAGSHMAPAAHMRPLGAGVTVAAPVQASAGMTGLQARPVAAVSAAMTAAMPAGSRGVMYVPFMPLAFMPAAGLMHRFPLPPPPPPPPLSRMQHRQQQ